MEQPKWLDRGEYPFLSHFFDDEGTKQHYIDVGKGDTLLFVHGTPSWSFDFRNVIKCLSNSYRCVAIDHIGFGLSDKPTDYDYTVQHHARRLERFIAYMGLKSVTLVLHDFGGPIGLSYAIKFPENINRLVILNSWIGSSEADPEFIKLSKVLRSPLLPFLYLYLNFSPKFLLSQSFGKKKLSRNILSQFIKPFASKSQRYGLLSFAKSLLTDQQWFEALWNSRNSLQAKPFLLIWGMADKFITERYLYKFISGFENCEAVKLQNAGHFPQEEEPERVAHAIVSFMSD